MEQKQLVSDDLGRRGFKVFRTSTSRDDPMSGIEWDPPKESDELFEALKNAFPGRKTHRERMCEALMQFLAEELGSGSSNASSPEKPANDVKNSAIKAFQESKKPVFRMQATDQQQQKSLKEGSCPITKDNSSNMVDSKSAPKKSGKDWDDMTVVWKSNVGLTKGARPRRMMTEEERTDYRMRRVRGACVSCKRKKRKCNHDPEPSPSSSSDTLTDQSISPPTPPLDAIDKPSTNQPFTAQSTMPFPVVKQPVHTNQDLTVPSAELEIHLQVTADPNTSFISTGIPDSTPVLPLTGFTATDVLPFDFAASQYGSTASPWNTTTKNSMFDAPPTFLETSNEMPYLSGLDLNFVDPMMLGDTWNLENFDFDSFQPYPMAGAASSNIMADPAVQSFALQAPLQVAASLDLAPLITPQPAMKAFRSRVSSPKPKKENALPEPKEGDDMFAPALGYQNTIPQTPANPGRMNQSSQRSRRLVGFFKSKAEATEPVAKSNPVPTTTHGGRANSAVASLSELETHWADTYPQAHVEQWLSQKNAEHDAMTQSIDLEAKPQTITEDDSTQRRRVKFDLSTLIDGPPTLPAPSDEVSIDLIQATETSRPDIRARQRPSFIARPGSLRSASRNSTASRLSFSDIMSISSAFTGMSIKDGAASRRSSISGGRSEVEIDDDEDDYNDDEEDNGKEAGADDADHGCKPFDPMDHEWGSSGGAEDDSGSSEEGDDAQKVDWTEWNIQQTAATSVMHDREDLLKTKIEERIRKHLGDPARKREAKTVKMKK